MRSNPALQPTATWIVRPPSQLQGVIRLLIRQEIVTSGDDDKVSVSSARRFEGLPVRDDAVRLPDAQRLRAFTDTAVLAKK